MKVINKLFGGINLNWKKLILFAISCGLYAGIIAIIPIFKNTSFADITISFEVWILFGIIIILNSKSPKDSALKCFIFFLLSQPLIYLIQIPFNSLGWNIFMYYKYWAIWTILVLPIGYIGFYIKKNNWLSFLILLPILLFLGYHLYNFVLSFNYSPPHHILSIVFCIITIIAYSLFILKKSCIRITCFIVSALIVVTASAYALINPICYSTSIAASSNDQIFDINYRIELDNNNLGNIYIVKSDSDIDQFEIKGDFKRAGTTELRLISPDGKVVRYWLDVDYMTYDFYKL